MESCRITSNSLMEGKARMASTDSDEEKEAQRFAEAYFAIACELAKERGITQKELAVRSFGYEKGFYSVRSKEMNLTLANAFKMARVVGLKFSRLAELARVKLEEEEEGLENTTRTESKH